MTCIEYTFQHGLIIACTVSLDETILPFNDCGTTKVNGSYYDIEHTLPITPAFETELHNQLIF